MSDRRQHGNVFPDRRKSSLDRRLGTGRGWFQSQVTCWEFSNPLTTLDHAKSLESFKAGLRVGLNGINR